MRWQLWPALLALVSAAPFAGVAMAQNAHMLLDRYHALRPQLERNEFGRPLYLASTEDSDRLNGSVYAVVDESYDQVAGALRRPTAWCGILMLHPNVKRCRQSAAGSTQALAVVITSRYDEPAEYGHRLQFAFDVSAASDDYLAVVLHAASGPLGTSDYRIMLEAAPLPGQATFIHLSYAYASSFAARMALRLYLATSGRNKVGFTVVGRRPDGRPIYIDGFRGVVERNTMRYFLAIEAYLASLSEPASRQVEQRLQHWYSAIERYPRQLREVDRDEYLEIKRRELRSAQASARPS